MARISKEERSTRKTIYDEALMQLFVEGNNIGESGWKSCTFDNLAKVLGITKSTIQSYYLNVDEIRETVAKISMPKIIKELSFDGPESFIYSWKKLIVSKSVNGDIFRKIIQMLLLNVCDEASSGRGSTGLKRFYNMLETHFGSDNATLILEKTLGHSVMVIAEL